MISKLVRGFLWNKPMNLYELTKLAESGVIQEWFPLTARSIYTTIKKFAKKGYIIGESIQEGNMPPKILYSLTDKGKEELLSSLLEGMESYEAGASDFGISIFHIGLLDQEQALQYVDKRLKKLGDLLNHAQSRLECSLPHIPFNMKTMLTYNIYRIENEIRITKELANENETSSTWNTSFSDLVCPNSPFYQGEDKKCSGECPVKCLFY